MAPRVIDGMEELKSLVGSPVGSSDWVEITQERVQKFAEATGDHQWIHCDVDRARAESPYGTTIAHGYLTLSLCPALAQQVFSVAGVRMGVNYGLNRVRFPSAVRVGSRVRLNLLILKIREIQGGAEVTYKASFEVEGEDKPACVAETIARIYF